jgi:hypothetical protein
MLNRRILRAISCHGRYPSFFAFLINSEPNCRADRPDSVISMSRISNGFSRLFSSSLTTTRPSLARTFGMVRAALARIAVQLWD